MTTPTQDFYFSELSQIGRDFDGQIEEAEQQIQQWKNSKQALAEIDEHLAHFDSVACGSLKIDESTGTIEASISVPEIGERVKELHRSFGWETFEVDHLEDLDLFQVQMEMPLTRLREGIHASDTDD